MATPSPFPAVAGPDPWEAKAALLMRLRSHGVRSIPVLRAMETVPREAFVPASCAADAHRDIVLPIGCGQSMAEPSFVAVQLEALAPTPGCRVVEIGSGSGYVTALLAQLAGSVQGFERFQALAEAARERAGRVGGIPVAVAWADGLDPDAHDGPVDRVLLHVAVPAPPPGLLERLAPGGIMVCALAAGEGRQDLVRFLRGGEGAITATRIGRSRLPPAMAGRSQVL